MIYYMHIEMKPLSGKRKVYDRTLRFFLYLCAGITCALLVFLIGYIFYKGLPHINLSFLTSQSSYLNDTIGILPNIVNTIYVIVVALIFILPIGVGAAVYLTEYTKNRRLVSAIEFATETLTGIPSIIYGLVGMLFFSQFLGLQASLLAGSLTLVIMTLPTIIRTTQESLKTVPQSYREGALGLGAGKWHMIRTIVLPSSVDGIVTGCILAIGRVVGETAALIYTAGTVADWPKGVMSSGRTLAVHMYVLSGEGLHVPEASATAVVLLVIVVGMNALSSYVAKKLTRG